MSEFVVTGRCLLTPPATDWREQLAQLLGKKPRRIGLWAELGLFGALRCMADAGEASLPPDAMLVVSSRQGTYAAAVEALAQMREGLPMPLTFLQTQPSQLLALLAAQMDWTGPACFLAAAQSQDLLRLLNAQTGRGGVLLGHVDEAHGGSSKWLRLRQGVTEKYDFSSAFLDWQRPQEPNHPV
jgi:hypothetical protein